jgi:hypothetical protein
VQLRYDLKMFVRLIFDFFSLYCQEFKALYEPSSYSQLQYKMKRSYINNWCFFFYITRGKTKTQRTFFEVFIVFLFFPPSPVLLFLVVVSTLSPCSLNITYPIDVAHKATNKKTLRHIPRLFFDLYSCFFSFYYPDLTTWNVYVIRPFIHWWDYYFTTHSSIIKFNLKQMEHINTNYE